MISKAEREHIQKIKQWSAARRKGLAEVKEHPLIGPLLKKLAPNQPEPLTVVFDNVDWLIALMERELHTQGVKNLLGAVDAYSKKDADGKS